MHDNDNHIACTSEKQENDREQTYPTAIMISSVASICYMNKHCKSHKKARR